MATISRRTTRASARASPAPSVDEDEPAAVVTPRASGRSRRTTEGAQQRTPQPNDPAAITPSGSSERLGTASVARPVALRRQVKQSASADVLSQNGEGVTATGLAPRRVSRSSTLRLSSARPSRRAASIAPPELPATFESDADMVADGGPSSPDKSAEDDEDEGEDGEEDPLETALRTNPDALWPILGSSMRLLTHYFGSLVRPMPENLPDVYYQMMLEAMSAAAPALALDSAPYQLHTARQQLRVANTAIFLRGIWLNEDQLADGGIVRPEKVRDFAEARSVFLDIFAGPGGVALDEQRLLLFLELSTQLYILQRRTTIHRTAAARNALVKQLFPPDLIANRVGSTVIAAQWRELCQDRVREIKRLSLEDLRLEHPYHDTRYRIVSFCKSEHETGAEVGEELGGGLARRASGSRLSFGAIENRRSISVARSRHSEPLRRPRYTADLPAPLGPKPSPLGQGRQSMPAGMQRLSSRPYTPSNPRQVVRRTPVINIPPDEESTADEAALRMQNANEVQTEADEADDDELVEDELSERETDLEDEPSEMGQSTDAEVESDDEARSQLDESEADGDHDTDLDGEDRSDAADHLAGTPRPAPRAFRPREGKQKAVSPNDRAGTPLARRAVSSSGDVLAVSADDDEDEVALLTQVDGSESQPKADEADGIPWDNLWDDEESAPFEEEPKEDALASPSPQLALQPEEPPSTVRLPLPTAPPAAEAVERPVEAAILTSAPVPAQQVDDSFYQDAMGGGAWSPEPEQRPASPNAAGPSQQAPAPAPAPVQAPAAVPRSSTAASRPPRPSVATRQRPSRARPSQALRADFSPLDASDEDERRTPAQPPLQTPRSVNRHSPIDFDPPPRGSKRGATKRDARASPPPPPPTPTRDRSVIGGGRHFWTEDETLFLVRKAMALHSENNNPFATLVRNYGTDGRKNTKLAGRTNVQLKDKLRHYLATSYKYPKPVPAGLVRYLPTSDPRYKPSHRAVTASQAEAAGPPRKRPRDEREEVHSDLSSGSSGESDDGSEAASMESEGE